MKTALKSRGAALFHGLDLSPNVLNSPAGVLNIIGAEKDFCDFHSFLSQLSEKQSTHLEPPPWPAASK